MLYYSCYKHPIRNCYNCKKFDNFFDADKNTVKTIKNSVSNLECQTIKVSEVLHDFIQNLYIRYRIIKSKFDFKIKVERAQKREF